MPSRKAAENIDVKALRGVLNLSQSQFAMQFGFNLRTLQQWEQGRCSPDRAAKVFLTVISRSPDAVRNALSIAVSATA